MNIDVNPLYVPIFTSKCRYFHLWGGRSRGASHFATDYFLWKMTQPQYFRGAMLRATMTEITQSLWVALQKRIKTAIENKDLIERDVKININEHVVTYIPTGNQIICKGFRKTTSASGANLKGLEGITHAIVEEAEDVFAEDFDELDATFRTTEVKNIQIFVLFNPPGKNHWLIQRYYELIPIPKIKGWYSATQKNGTEDELLAIHSNYTDNSINVNESTKRLYKNKGNKNSPLYDPDYYYRSVLGLISEGKKGRIFLKVKKISREEYDSLHYEEFGGLDFGFSSDPAAGSIHKHHNGKLYSRQVVYERGLENEQLAKKLKLGGITRNIRTYADSSEPKSISTLNRYDLLIIGAIKGPGTIEWGYRELLSVEWYICEDSLDFWKEIEEHRWAMDAEKNPTDVPEDDWNHLIDSSRYAYTMNVSRKNLGSVNSETGDEEKRTKNQRLLDSINEERIDESTPLEDEDEEEYYKSLGYGYEDEDEDY